MGPVETCAKPQEGKHINNGAQPDSQKDVIFLEFLVQVNQRYDYNRAV